MMAVLLISGKLLPVIPLLPWKAEAARQGDTMTAYGPDFHHYCIDGAGANRALIDGDEYTYILPSETLSREETALVFWGMLTLQASFGNVPQVNAVIRNINEGAAAQGVPAISNLVTEADLKLLIHSSAVRGKYSWLSAVLAQEETYLRLAGLLGGTGGGSGMGIPAALQGHTQAGNPAAFTPAQDSGRPGEYVLTFDPSGADAEFIRSVPLKFSSTGAEGSFTPQLPSGWVCQKTDSQIRLTSTGGSGSLYLMFDVRGTRYASGGGTFSSPEEVYEQCLQIWRCSRCAGTHRQMYNGAAPLATHQRLAFVEVSAPELCYYAGVGGGQVTPEEGGVAFQIYRHEEDWTSTYNVRLRKYDHETGKALENAVFSLYERFDDKDQIYTDRDGAAHLYAGGAPYKSYHKDSPVLWEDFRFVSAMMTDGAGEATKTVEHGYHYDKTFCDGHPAPVFVPVPEEEEDEETGEIENQAEIDAAKEENRRLGSLWLNTFASCAAWASGNFSGVHFHWLMPEVDQGEIGRIASSGGEEGETPSAGTTVSAAGPRSFADSGCEADTGETYDRFIALKYSYAITEDTAREGYTLHGNHRDDLPIEVITTDASENGANASFAGIYSHEIRVNDGAVAESARMVRDVRAQAEEGWMAMELEHAGSEATEPEAPRHRKERKSFWQKVFPVFFLEETGEEPLLDDRKPSNAGETAAAGATASNAGETAAAGATASNVGPDAAAVKRAASVSVSVASASDVSGLRTAKTEDEESEADMDAADEDLATAPAQWILKLQFPSRAAAASGSAMPVREAARASGSGGTLFPDAYNRGLNMASSGKTVPPGPSGQYSHCNGRDGEDDWWRIYDHRTEGEIHINKRDLDLKAGENGTYDSYGDTQGDAVLEGAVYGLFAAKDLVHPDGKTGVVYRKNDLVAVTSTDKNGDGSFLACTEAPGRTYHYEAGQIENRPGDWNQTAPSNLYNRSQSFDDYTEDGRYTRDYPDYETANGNCWIGRPLLMGDYYVKELSRSEGYELSIGNRKHPWTNAGQDPEILAAETARTGYAVVTKGLYAEQQVQSGASGAYGDPTFRELFFQVNSEKSGGFDLVFYGIPAGSRLYRLDTTVKTESAPIGTGRFTESVETDAWGNPVYVTTEYEGQYPKYDAEGNLLTRNRPVNRTVTDVPRAEEVELDTARCEELLLRAEQGMDEEAVLTKLRKPFARDDLEFVKYKLELILRAHGKGTPKQDQESGSRYTTLDRPVYDTGYQSGAQICFGVPVVTLQVPRTQENGDAVTAGELLAAVLEYYQEHAYLSYGGVDCVEETEDVFEVSVYAGRSGNPECFYVPEAEGRSTAFYLRIPVTPESGSPRYTYAVYTGEDEAGSFGTFAPLTTGRDEEKTVTWPKGEKQEEEEAATWSDRMSAVLVPDAQAEPDGSLVTRCIAETVYYEPGEIPLDASGNRIPKLLYIEETVMGETQKHYGSWTELDSKTDEMVWHAESSYTDVYGQTHWDDTLQQYTFKLVLPGPEQTVLTEEDMPYLAGSWAPGDTMGTAAYYERVKRAGVRAYLDQAAGIGGENSFVKQISLVYPGQSAVWQDGDGRPGSGTSAEPLALEERGIRQRIRVSKTIEKTSYRNTSSYADAHKDWWTDRDRTTLSVDIPNQAGGAEAATEYYGISAMLPYGSYVVVEQQPKYASLEDFKNRHYETDKPKEIELPAVYASEAGAQASPGMLDPFYCYKASDTAAKLEKRYQIRFLEESHVIRAHSDRGDFEIYKYGMETDRIRNGAVEHPGAGDYISLTQSEYRPRQNYYNAQDDRTAGTVPYYLSEGQNGREAVSKVYRYSSVSEQARTADDVWYPGGSSTEDNVPGIWYRDGVTAMQGSQTAYDGRYAPMLVPYSVVREPESGPDSLDYANVRFRNRLYTARLRLEKLDSDTHENILHDGAVFRIYAAKRDDTKDGEGRVLFYEEDTQIIGSEEFLTAMGAADIRPVLRGRNLWSHLIEVPENTNRSAAGARGITDGLETTELCTGVVPAGTPVCEESEQILLGDRFGLQTGVMKAFVTVRDGLVSRPGSNSENAGGGSLETGSENVPGGGMEYQLQTVGYLNTPQPLSAGTYVLCETRPPVGYARSKPVALELYSDQVAYYQRGTPDSRVLAAIYEDPADAQTTYKTKPQDEIHTARIYLENEPIRLQVKKLAAQAESGAQNAASPYAAGATMTLFDAISLTPSGDSQDFTYEGLVIERNDAGHIDRMYVKKGYGGEKTEFLPERDDEGRLYTAPWPAGVDRYGEMIYTEGNVWNSVTVMRPDTDILYYDLSDLVLEITPETDGKDGRYQAFAWKGALKFLEFDGGDLTKLAYDAKDKVLTVDAGTHVYHLGRDGARDALVDPYTGMAYVVRDFDGTNGSLDQIRGRDGTGAGKKQVLVWPVNIRRDSCGNILARDKITTFRAALAGAGEEAYLTGSWKSQAGEESHRESTLSRNAQGRNLNEEALLDDNNGSFEKSMDPVYDRHGLVAYYQQSREAYDKAAELYDRNGDFVRSQHSDNLEAYNHAAYAVQEHNAQIDENQALLHRNGEAYVMENTWTTSEQYPNDPFTSVMTEGGGEILERVAAGTYIMEELEAPEGFAKALPVGIAVEETAKIQTVAMVDEPTRTEFSKIDGCSDPSGDAAGSLTTAGENSAFDCGYVKGAVLGLWKTEGGFAGLRGRKMQKEQDAAERRQEEPAECIAEWTTEETPHGITQLPVGSYLWKEIQVPSGFVSHDPVPVTVTDRPELQKFEMKEDHTRVEVEKYCLENGKDSADGEVPVAGAGFTLYPAKLDASGAVCRDENGHPLYVEDLPVAHWTTDDGTTYQEFPAAFEAMYLEHGAKPGSSVAWNDGADLYRAVYESEWQKELLHPQDSKQTVYTYRTEGGARIRIGVTKEQDPLADHLFRFEYQFEWQQLPKVNAYACTYLTLENRQRFDYLPAGASYVLVETEVPPGFARAKAVLVTVKDTGEVQLYRVENEEGTLLISKVYENGSKELAGARLALYRADEEGGLTRSSRYLFDSWVSGSDGRYTELDAINRRIPQGYAAGDLKPHRIRRLPDGIYWLAEQESPAYYTTFEPVQIVYEWQPEIRILRVNDRPVTGKLILKKTDSAGSPLDGAVFELAAYSEAEQKRCTGMSSRKAPGGPYMAQPVFSVRLTAPAEKTNLPVGEVLENGAICPFWYELREIEAPSGYERNPEVFCWQFAPDTGVVSYPWNGQAQYQITVTDRKTPEPEPPGPDTPEPEKPEPDTPKPKPPEPQKPEETPGDSGHENPKTPEPEIQPVLRIGKILAWYQPSSPDGTGWLYLGPDGHWRMRLPKMGDIRQTQLFAGLFILAAVGLGLAGTGTKCCGGFRGRRRKKKWKK